MRWRGPIRWRRWRLVIILLAVPVLLVGAVIGGLNFWVVRSTAGRIFDQANSIGPGYDAILVLGAGILPSGQPSPMLADRLKTGIALYEAGVAPVLLLSGDNSSIDYNEVEVMRRYVTDHGVPPGDVYRDFAGFSTYESLYRARDVFGVKRVAVVTQRYHLYRAVFDADRLGLDAVGLAAAAHPGPGQRDRDRREIAARVKDPVIALFDTKPTFLGPPIDLIPGGATRPEAGPVVSGSATTGQTGRGAGQSP